jgi:hypothetical protein
VIARRYHELTGGRLVRNFNVPHRRQVRRASGKYVDNKERILELHAKGHSGRAIAEIMTAERPTLRFSRTSVDDWIKAWKAEARAENAA